MGKRPSHSSISVDDTIFDETIEKLDRTFTKIDERFVTTRTKQRISNFSVSITQSVDEQDYHTFCNAFLLIGMKLQRVNIDRQLREINEAKQKKYQDDKQIATASSIH